MSVCPSAFNSPSLSIAVQRRGLSTGDSPQDDSALTKTERPRWSYTPPAAKAPFSLHLDSKRPEFLVNEDPATLDQFYIRILGTNGDKLLSDEIKWLAITHKSFDQGRRGFNDRLAFLGMSKEHPVHTEGVSTYFFDRAGKRIVQLQASLALAQDAGSFARRVPEDPFGRAPFTHPALDGLANLSRNTKDFLTSKSKLSTLARDYKLHNVIRWSPRMVSDVVAEVVLHNTNCGNHSRITWPCLELMSS